MWDPLWTDWDSVAELFQAQIKQPSPSHLLPQLPLAQRLHYLQQAALQLAHFHLQQQVAAQCLVQHSLQLAVQGQRVLLRQHALETPTMQRGHRLHKPSLFSAQQTLFRLLTPAHAHGLQLHSMLLRRQHLELHPPSHQQQRLCVLCLASPSPWCLPVRVHSLHRKQLVLTTTLLPMSYRASPSIQLDVVALWATAELSAEQQREPNTLSNALQQLAQTHGRFHKV
jgi:hypothetical protein